MSVRQDERANWWESDKYSTTTLPLLECFHPYCPCFFFAFYPHQRRVFDQFSLFFKMKSRLRIAQLPSVHCWFRHVLRVHHTKVWIGEIACETERVRRKTRQNECFLRDFGGAWLLSIHICVDAQSTSLLPHHTLESTYSLGGQSKRESMENRERQATSPFFSPTSNSPSKRNQER